MKTRNRTIIPVACVLAIGPLALSAGAAMIMNITDNGTDTVITASGSFNVTDLTLATTGGGGGINPSGAFLEITNAAFEVYQGVSGPSNFGTGGFTALSTASGDRVGIRLGFGSAITVPAGYVSGSPLAAEGSITGSGFGDLGITPGTYVWTWGSGPTADSLTINATVIPEPSTSLLFGLGFFALISRRRRS